MIPCETCKHMTEGLYCNYLGHELRNGQAMLQHSQTCGVNDNQQRSMVKRFVVAMFLAGLFCFLTLIASPFMLMGKMVEMWERRKRA